MFDDFDETDFADLGALLIRAKADLVMSCPAFGRSATRKVMFNFAPAVLDEIGGPRFDVGYARSRKTGHYAFRLQAKALGRFEAVNAPRGERRLIRVPVPAFGFTVVEDKAEPEFFVDKIGKAILVEVPAAFRPSAPKALPAPASRPATGPAAGMGLDDETTKAIEARVKELLTGNTDVPETIGGHRFSIAERGILAALLKHPYVRREGLLAACHNPEKGEDDRDPKLVDVYFSKMRGRLAAIVAEITRVDTGTYALNRARKLALRRAIEVPS